MGELVNVDFVRGKIIASSGVESKTETTEAAPPTVMTSEDFVNNAVQAMERTQRLFRQILQCGDLEQLGGPFMTEALTAQEASISLLSPTEVTVVYASAWQQENLAEGIA